MQHEAIVDRDLIDVRLCQRCLPTTLVGSADHGLNLPPGSCREPDDDNAWPTADSMQQTLFSTSHRRQSPHAGPARQPLLQRPQ